MESSLATHAKSKTSSGPVVVDVVSQKFRRAHIMLCDFRERGDCATCEIFLAGRLTKPCVAKVPPEPKLKSLQEKGLEIRM